MKYTKPKGGKIKYKELNLSLCTQLMWQNEVLTIRWTASKKKCVSRRFIVSEWKMKRWRVKKCEVTCRVKGWLNWRVTEVWMKRVKRVSWRVWKGNGTKRITIVWAENSMVWFEYWRGLTWSVEVWKVFVKCRSVECDLRMRLCDLKGKKKALTELEDKECEFKVSKVWVERQKKKNVNWSEKVKWVKERKKSQVRTWA